MTTPVHPPHNLRILALACLLTSCTGDAAGPSPAELQPVFDVTVTVRYLEVSSSEACDERNLLTDEPRDGEFQYRIEVESGDRFGFTESEGYGTFLGAHFSRLPGELINFANVDFRFSSLEPGEEVTIRLFGTEWDLTERDSRMDNRRTERVLPSTLEWEVGTFRGRSVTVPSNGSLVCELTLIFDMSVASRRVAVPVALRFNR